MLLYGVFCPRCGVCFFPTDEIVVGHLDADASYRCKYSELNLKEMEPAGILVADTPIHHAFCVEKEASAVPTSQLPRPPRGS